MQTTQPQERPMNETTSIIKKQTLASVGFIDFNDYQWDTWTLETVLSMTKSKILDFRRPEEYQVRKDN